MIGRPDCPNGTWRLGFVLDLESPDLYMGLIQMTVTSSASIKMFIYAKHTF
jgi:hypothetical protein